VTGQSKILVGGAVGGSTVLGGFLGGVKGQILLIENVGPGPILLPNAVGAPGNQLFTPLGLDYEIPPRAGCIIQYDTVVGDGFGNAVWRFDEPTLGVFSSAGTPAYACNNLLFHSDLGSTTLNGRLLSRKIASGQSQVDWQGLYGFVVGGSNIGPIQDIGVNPGTNITATVAAGASPIGGLAAIFTINATAGSIAHGQAYLDSDYTTTGSYAVVQGATQHVRLTLAAQGTYQISFTLAWSIPANVAEAQMSIRVMNTTDSTVVWTASDFAQQLGGQINTGAGGCTFQYTTTGANKVIELQANGPGMTGGATIFAAGSGGTNNFCTTLSYLLIG
jgi:hypothetical protein